MKANGLVGVDSSEVEFDLELRITDDLDVARKLLDGEGVQLGWTRREDRFSGDPATIITIVTSITTLLMVVNKILHSWQRDVVIDVRKKNCIVQKKLESRNGTLTIIKPNGNLEQISQPNAEAFQKVHNLLKRTL